MTDPDVYQGRARRRCRDCGVEIEIEKPTRIVSRTSTRAWRKTARQEVGRQICWEMRLPVLQSLVERSAAPHRSGLR